MIVINGDFLCRNLTGIERFAYEVLVRLDKLVPANRVQLYVPANGKNIPELDAIQTVVSEAECGFFPAWEHRESCLSTIFTQSSIPRIFPAAEIGLLASICVSCTAMPAVTPSFC